MSLTCHGLTFLSIIRCTNVTYVGICALISFNPLLKTLEWDGMNVGYVIDELARSCNGLALAAFVGSDLTDSMVEQLVISSPLLERLELPGCTSLSPICLTKICKLARLEYLDISECNIRASDLMAYRPLHFSFECNISEM